MCLLLSVMRSSSELEECGVEIPRRWGGPLINCSTSGSLTTWQNSSRPRNAMTSSGSRSLNCVWICAQERIPVLDASMQCSLKYFGAKIRPWILWSSLSMSRMIQLSLRFCLFLRNRILMRSLRASDNSHSRSAWMGIG